MKTSKIFRGAHHRLASRRQKEEAVANRLVFFLKRSAQTGNSIRAGKKIGTIAGVGVIARVKGNVLKSSASMG